MATNEIDEISVRLTADAVDLLKNTDDAIKDVEDSMDDLGASVQDSMEGAMDGAGRAVVAFAEKFKITIEDAAVILEKVGGFDELFGVGAEELAAAARNIQDNITSSVDDATSAIANLGAAGAEALLGLEGMADPLKEAGQAARDVATSTPAAIDSGLVQPVDSAGESTRQFGDDVKKVMGDDVPASLEEATTQAERFGSAYEGAMSTIRTESTDSEEAVKGMTTEIASGFDDLAQRIRQISEQFRITFVQAAGIVAQSAEAYGITADEIRNTLNAMEEFVPLNKRAADAMAALDEQIEYVGEHMDKKLMNQIERFKEEVGDLNNATIDQVNQLGEFNDEVSRTSEVLDMARPKIAAMVADLQSMGAALPDVLDESRWEAMAVRMSEVADSSDELSDSFDAYLDKQQKSIVSSQGLGSVTDELGQLFGLLGGELGGVAQGLISVISKGAGIVALFTVLKKLADLIAQAAERAIEFNAMAIQSAVALRLQANATGEAVISTGDYIGRLTEISNQFGLSRDAMIGATNQLLLMNQQMGLSEDQVFALATRGAALAKVFDKEVTPVMTNLAQFVATGMRSGLDDFALQLDEVAIRAKAVELGFSANLDTLTAQQQAYVRLNLVLDQTAQFEEAAGAMAETMASRMDKANEQIDIATQQIGNVFAPALVALKELWADVATGFANAIQLIVLLWLRTSSTIIASMMATAATIVKIWEDVKDLSVAPLGEYRDMWQEAFGTARADLLQEGVDRMLGSTEEFESGLESLAATAQQTSDEVIDATYEMVDAFVDAAEQFDESMAQIARRYMDTMEDITRTFAQRRADAEVDLQRDLRDIDRDAAIARMDAIREYQVDEIRLREDFQMDIRQLEERFVLDLEDAVRDRDARQVLNLQRRFNLEKKQREEDYLLRQKRLKEDFKIELQEIERQRLIRRQERIAQFQEELLDLQEQEARRREQARINRERAERDLLETIRRRLLLLSEGAAAELEIEQQKLVALRDALIAAYGPNGWIEQIYAQSIARRTALLQQSIAQASALASAYNVQATQSLAGTSFSTPYDVQSVQSLSGFSFRQRGGTILATSPTAFVAGEGRPERIDITPLSESTGEPAAGFRNGEMGGGEAVRIELDVNASEELIIDVADQAMSEIAEVIVSVNQKNQGGGRVG